MKIVPKHTQIVGRVADLSKSKGGIVLAPSTEKGVTVFVVVESIGPDVKNCKPGDVIVPYRVSNVYIRGGQYRRVLVDDAAVLAAVEDLPRDQFTIEGEDDENSENGMQAGAVS